MKTFFKLIILTLLTTTFSCSSDDDSSDDAGLVGSWNLINLTTTESIDLNLDGIESMDILSEISCSEASFTFMANGDVNSSEIDVTIQTNDDGTELLICEAATSFGTWELIGDQLTTINEGETKTFTIILSNNTFSFSPFDESLGNVTSVYQRQ